MLVVDLLVYAQKLSDDKLRQPLVSPGSGQRSVVGSPQLAGHVLFCGELIGLLHHRQELILEDLLLLDATVFLYL